MEFEAIKTHILDIESRGIEAVLDSVLTDSRIFHYS